MRYRFYDFYFHQLIFIKRDIDHQWVHYFSFVSSKNYYTPQVHICFSSFKFIKSIQLIIPWKLTYFHEKLVLSNIGLLLLMSTELYTTVQITVQSYSVLWISKLACNPNTKTFWLDWISHRVFSENILIIPVHL